MLIEALEAILRDLVVTLLCLGTAILAVSLGGTAAVFGIGRMVHARAARVTPALPAEPPWPTTESEGYPSASR